MRLLLVPSMLLALTATAAAQTAPGQFSDGPKGEKVDAGSGLVCPDRIGTYVRDAAGERDPGSGGVFCSYYGFDGIYGTIRVTPLNGPYAPPEAFASDFAMEEGTGARPVVQQMVTLGPKTAPLAVFDRSYETSHLETLHYRIAYTGAAVKGWAVETITEYAEPRDNAAQTAFLDWAYGPAVSNLHQHNAVTAKP